MVGIPQSVKDDDLEKLVTKVVNKVGINITERGMQAVYRIWKEGRTIIKFSSRKDCQALLKIRRDLNNLTMKDFGFEEKNKIYVNKVYVLTIGSSGQKVKYYIICRKYLVFM